MKKLFAAAIATVCTCALAFGATFIAQQELHIDHDDSTAIEVINNDASGQNVYAESRVTTANCRGDLYSVGPSFTDGSSMLPNETGFVAESDCAGLNIKDNSDTYTRFTFSNVEAARIVQGSGSVDGGAQFTGVRNAFLNLKNRNSGAVAGVLVDDGGNTYIGSQTNNPFHLMANNNATITVYPGGGLEIWPGTCPVPQHSGVSLCVNEAGQLIAVGKTGTVTTLAQP